MEFINVIMELDEALGKAQHFFLSKEKRSPEEETLVDKIQDMSNFCWINWKCDQVVEKCKNC